MKWNSELYDRHHHFVSEYGNTLIDLLPSMPNQKILDIGCGTGDLAYQLTEQGHLVTGMDASAEMVKTARKKYPKINFIQADAANFSLEESFDTVISNATLHWIPKTAHPNVLKMVSKHLKKGGAFLAEFGGAGNILSIRTTINEVLKDFDYSDKINADKKTWYFPKKEDYAQLLKSEGFEVEMIEIYERPTPLSAKGEGLKKWLNMFGAHWFSGIPAEKTAGILEEIENRLKPILYKNGQWIADYIRLRFRAKRIQN